MQESDKNMPETSNKIAAFIGIVKERYNKHV